MVEAIAYINSVINDFVWGPVMIFLILFTGLLLTIRIRCKQVTKLGTSCKMAFCNVLGKGDGEKSKGGSISQFKAFSTAIAGTIGTGNIIGVSTAIVSGGAGAVFWMWVSAFFGMATNYSENVLGIYFRKTNSKGEFSGGPMYYISEGLSWKKVAKGLAILFGIFCILASFGYNMTQSNSISGTLNVTYNIPTYVTGILLAVLILLVTVGGIKRIGTFAAIVVPFMALIFIIMALSIIIMNVAVVGEAFALIFSSAFSLEAVGGGIMGYTIMRAIRYGLARGIFSNEAGLGSSVIAHSVSDVKEPVEQGLWGIFEVFLDTFVICTLMALVLICTGAFGTTDASGELLTGSALASLAFSSSLGGFGSIVFASILPLFAFTTILSWSFYGEKAVEYVFGEKAKIIYKLVYIVFIFVGAITSLELVWSIADTFNGLMAIPNLISLILLSGLVAKITTNYFKRKKGEDLAPMLSAYDE